MSAPLDSMLLEPIQTKGNCFCAHFPDNFENVQERGSSECLRKVGLELCFLSLRILTYACVEIWVLST